MTQAAVEVTPTGHGLEHWADRRGRAERLDLPALAERLGVTDGAAMVVVAAHPDDETLGLGRLLYGWSCHLGPVTAVVASAGEACLDHVGPRPEGLAERRLAEWYAATTILGVSARHTLGLPDGSLASWELALVDALVSAIDDLLPRQQQVVLACPWRLDPHPDHQAVGRATSRAGRLRHLAVLEFGVWMTYWSDPEDLDADGRTLAMLETDDDAERAHQRACAAFATQFEPMAAGLGPVVPPAMLAHHGEQLLILASEPAHAATSAQPWISPAPGSSASGRPHHQERC